MLLTDGKMAYSNCIPCRTPLPRLIWGWSISYLTHRKKKGRNMQLVVELHYSARYRAYA